MERGDPIPCRCPKCKGQDLTVAEEFSAFDVYHVRAGKLDDRVYDPLPNPTGATYGECLSPNCRHRWKFRKSPLQTAFEEEFKP